MIRKIIANKIGFPLQDFMNQTEIIKTEKFLMESQYWDEQRMNEYREKKLRALIHHAYENTVYYRELFDRKNLHPDDITTFRDLVKIPILTKETARKNKEKLYSKKIDHKTVKKGKTGGTTGVPLEFYKDTNDRSFAWGSYYRWYNWMGVERGDKVVTIWGASTVTKSSISNYKNNFVAWLQNNKRINSFNLSEDKLDKVYGTILRQNPVLIKGYLSAIILIAKFMKKQKLRPNENLKAISTTTETLLPVYRDLLETVFQVPVYDQYGCGEVSAISYECSAHRGLHINEEHVHVEVVDKKDSAIYDETGRLIVTSLNNFAMPFIRYENGDMAALFKLKCDCGLNSALMSSIDGRATDTIKLKNGSEVHGVYFTDILYELGITTELIDRFQIQQNQSGEIDILLEKKGSLNEKLLQKIREEISKHVHVNNIQVIEHIESEESGKFKYIKRVN